MNEHVRREIARSKALVTNVSLKPHLRANTQSPNLVFDVGAEWTIADEEQARAVDCCRHLCKPSDGGERVLTIAHFRDCDHNDGATERIPQGSRLAFVASALLAPPSAVHGIQASGDQRPRNAGASQRSDSKLPCGQESLEEPAFRG